MRCSNSSYTGTDINGNTITITDGELKCSCGYYLMHGSCRHIAVARRNLCAWRGEPNMTMINNQPVKVCPKCGSRAI